MSAIPSYSTKSRDMGPFGFRLLNLDGSSSAYDGAVPHRHTFYELFFFTAKGGSHEIDFTNFQIRAGSVHIVTPGQIHRLIQSDTQGLVLCFSEEFATIDRPASLSDRFFFLQENTNPVLHFKSAPFTELTELISGIATEAKDITADKAEIIRSYLQIILLKLKLHVSAEIARSDRKPGNPIVGNFRRMVDLSFVDHMPLSEYAARLNVTADHLNSLCRKHEGRSASQLIQERMLLEAKRLLYGTDLSIKEISFQLNFESVPYFNRFFRKHTNLSPLEYRASVR